MEHMITPQPASKTKRPLGVWLLTLYAAISAGILPLVGVLVLRQTGFTLTSLDILLTALLAIAIIIVSVGTWRGSNRARVLLLVLITVHYALIAVNNALLLFSDGDTLGAEGRMVGRILRGFLYPAVYIWYFRRADVMQFFSARPEGAS